MKAVLLAAGLGTRLRPITNNLPKCLVQIHQKPLLAYWLELLLPQGIEEVLINTHYLASQVKEFIEMSPWRRNIRLVHEPILLGTAGTVHHNRAWLESGPFLVAHADNLTRFDVPAFLAAHAKRPTGVEITMMTFETDNPESCGIVALDNHGRVVNFYEKSAVSRGTHANAAVYILEPSVLKFLASLNKEIIDMSTEVIPHYLGRMHTYHNGVYHRDIGTMKSLACAEAEY